MLKVSKYAAVFFNFRCNAHTALLISGAFGPTKQLGSCLLEPVK
jgi:hypothetical protein